MTESRIHKKSMNFIHSIKVFGGGGWVGGGGGGGTPPSPFIRWNCVYAIALSRFYHPQGGCGILIKHGIRKFIVSTDAIVSKPFREQRVTKKPNKLRNCAWFLKSFWDNKILNSEFYLTCKIPFRRVISWHLRTSNELCFHNSIWFQGNKT